MKFEGCYPTMITPFKENGEVDYQAAENLVEWYIEHKASGIFAVCQSSEMFFLTSEEQVKLAKTVVDAAEKRIPVVVSGHTVRNTDAAIDHMAKMSETGADAVVLVSSMLAEKDESDEILKANADKIFTSLPDVVFGIYECPFPYLRLLSEDFLHWQAKCGNLKFIKDVACSEVLEKRRAEIVKGTPLALFNANTSTLLSSLEYGYEGYCGVMGNFHIDLYDWLFRNYKKDAKTARELQDFLTLAAVLEARAYPVSAKWYQSEYGVKMSINTRSKDSSILNENAIHEIVSLKRMEDKWRKKLNI